MLEQKRFFALYSLIRLCPFRRTTRYTTPVRHYSNTVYPIQSTVQRIPSGERTRQSSHAETENMERGRVVNRHVAPRTNTVSSFREVSEGAGNAGLHRAPWPPRSNRWRDRRRSSLERTEVERNRTRFIETKIFEKEKKTILTTRTDSLLAFYFCYLFFSFPS